MIVEYLYKHVNVFIQKNLLFILLKYISEVKKMPDANVGREKVLQYLKENNIQKIDLAVLYGIPKQDIGNYLEGKLVDTPKAKQLLVKIIADFKIR
ncbi:TPA: hypothetical protein J0U68_002605 [Enterococcus faecium]|nr:hypothetical protein [Enterococcus faecium]